MLKKQLSKRGQACAIVKETNIRSGRASVECSCLTRASPDVLLCEGRLHGEKRVILPRPSPAYLRTISQIRGPRNWTGGKYVKLAAAPLPQRKDGVKEARRGEARETQIVKRQGPDPGADKVVDPEEERMDDSPSDELMGSHG